MKSFSVFLANCIFVLTICESSWSSKILPELRPVILVAGFQGTQLEYTNSKISTQCLLLGSTIWLSILNFIPPFDRCYLELFSIRYDRATRLASNAPGVEVRPAGEFGSTKANEWLAPFPQHIETSLYFDRLITGLELHGYKRDVSIRAAPYDWRYAPNQQENFFENFKDLVERTYIQNGNKSVILLGHSMGGPFLYVFLKSVDLEWKQKYVRVLVPVASPWGGNFKYMYGFLYHDDFPANLFPVTRPAERTFPTTAFLVPQTRAWGDDTVFIETPTKNYTISNLDEFFQKINMENAYQLYLDVKDILGDLSHPEVDVHLLGGNGKKTLRALKYPKDDFKSKRTVIYGNGDEFVNIESFEACFKWRDEKEYSFKVDTMQEDHLGLIRNPAPIAKIADIILSYQ